MSEMEILDEKIRIADRVLSDRRVAALSAQHGVELDKSAELQLDASSPSELHKFKKMLNGKTLDAQVEMILDDLYDKKKDVDEYMSLSTSEIEHLKETTLSSLRDAHENNKDDVARLDAQADKYDRFLTRRYDEEDRLNKQQQKQTKQLRMA
jgi:hypothetical protein